MACQVLNALKQRWGRLTWLGAHQLDVSTSGDLDSCLEPLYLKLMFPACWWRRC